MIQYQGNGVYNVYVGKQVLVLNEDELNEIVTDVYDSEIALPIIEEKVERLVGLVTEIYDRDELLEQKNTEIVELMQQLQQYEERQDDEIR